TLRDQRELRSRVHEVLGQRCERTQRQGAAVRLAAQADAGPSPAAGPASLPDWREMRTTTTHNKNERGQTMTELAIILPILVVLVLGIAQFGVVFNNYVTMTDAVRAGARKGAVSRNLSDPTTACVQQVRDASGGLNQSDLDVTCSSTWQPGADLTVTATYPYDVSLLGWVVASGRLNTTMKERVE